MTDSAIPIIGANRHQRRAASTKAQQGLPLSQHEQEVATRVARLEQFQKIATLIKTDYFKAVMMLTEGARAALTGQGMSHTDAVTNIADVLSKMLKHVEARRGDGTAAPES